MQAALKTLGDFESAQRSVKVLEQTGLLQARFLEDADFQGYLNMLKQIDMGREPELMLLGLHHWSRRWEYPFAIHGALRYLLGQRVNRARVLDAACGFSPVPFLIAAYGHEVIGLDMDDVYLKRWEQYHVPGAAETGSTTFQFGNMEETKFPDNHFDLVYCVSSLEHTSNPDKGLKEFHRITKPGGMILLTCDSEPAGSIGMESSKLERMLSMMDGQGRLYYPPRWCHPQETLTFLTRAEVRNQSAFMKFARGTKEAMRANKSANMAVLGIAWIKN